MRTTLIGLIAVALGAAAQTGKTQESSAVMTAVSQFVDAFNKGDAKAIAAACSEQASVIDEFPPHEWHGVGACTKWASDYDVDAKKRGITDGLVTIGKPRHLDISGDVAYVVLPADYVYKMNGKPVKESGSAFTLVLRRSGGAWRIAGWSWSKN